MLEYYGGRLTATFLERRFELYGAWYGGASKLRSIRDKDGNVIVEANDAASPAVSHDHARNTH